MILVLVTTRSQTSWEGWGRTNWGGRWWGWLGWGWRWGGRRRRRIRRRTWWWWWWGGGGGWLLQAPQGGFERPPRKNDVFTLRPTPTLPPPPLRWNNQLKSQNPSKSTPNTALKQGKLQLGAPSFCDIWKTWKEHLYRSHDLGWCQLMVRTMIWAYKVEKYTPFIETEWNMNQLGAKKKPKLSVIYNQDEPPLICKPNNMSHMYTGAAMSAISCLQYPWIIDCSHAPWPPLHLPSAHLHFPSPATMHPDISQLMSPHVFDEFKAASHAGNPLPLHVSSTRHLGGGEGPFCWVGSQLLLRQPCNHWAFTPVYSWKLWSKGEGITLILQASILRGQPAWA